MYMTSLSPNLQSILDNRLRYLPEQVGKAIYSIDWSTELITIGKKYGLHIDDMEEFQGVVLKSMIGMIAPDQFENELITATAVSPTTANNMIHDINEKIFEPIHNMVTGQVSAPATVMEKTGIHIEPEHSDNSFSVQSSETPEPAIVLEDHDHGTATIFEVPEITKTAPINEEPDFFI